MAIITIIGAGRIGVALKDMLAVREDHDIRLWDIDSERVDGPSALSDALENASHIFLCISSWSLKGACDEIAPYVTRDMKIITVTKGIEPESEQFIDEYLSQRFPHQFALLVGPMIAEDMDGKKPLVAMLGSEHGESDDIFSGTQVYVVPTTDVRGVALSGILKNVYALGLGIADALLLGQNFKASFAVTAMHEMEHIAVGLGAKRETLYSFAGLGDLIVTGWSPTSRNRTLGAKLIQHGGRSGLDKTENSEGLQSILHLSRRMKRDIPPLYQGILDIIEGQELNPTNRLTHIVCEIS